MYKKRSILFSAIGVLIFCSSAFAQYETHSNKLPDVCFFPKGQAHWDGYKVTDRNWQQLTDEQKARFITEGIVEIKTKEELFGDLPDNKELFAAMNNAARIMNGDLTQPEMPMIKILHDLLIQSGFIKEVSNDVSTEKMGL